MSLIDQLQEGSLLSRTTSLADRIAWFDQARYGLFLHWGLYSLLGRGEWVRNREQVPESDYVKLVDAFDAKDFKPREWAAFATDCGMRYSVLTTKHHDGFCLWNSDTCQFNSVNSAARRDLVEEFVTAFRDEGLRVGLYYSLGDWHHPDWAKAAHGDEMAEGRFVSYTHQLVEELVTQYGRIDIMWYDLPQALTADQWRAEELNAMVRHHQPHILINNRSMLPEDFSISEQHLHPTPPGRKWEGCMTLNESWAYVEGDNDFKSPRAVARTLAKVASTGGNLLLNVGPTGSGALPPESRVILEQVGRWLHRNGEAVYAISSDRLPFNLWGSTLVVGSTLYLFLERYFGSKLTIGGLTNRIVAAKILGFDAKLSWERKGDQTTISGLPAEAPDPILTVLKIELDGLPDQSISRAIAGADIMASFPD